MNYIPDKCDCGKIPKLWSEELEYSKCTIYFYACECGEYSKEIVVSHRSPRDYGYLILQYWNKRKQLKYITCNKKREWIATHG